MKTIVALAIFLTVCTLDFTGCRKNDDNPIGSDSTATGKSFVAGYVALSLFEYNLGLQKYTGPLDFSGASIEVVNTPIKTYSDVKGYWQLTGLDAGAYTLLITKPGFDTIVVPDIVVKKNDSIFLGKRENRWDKVGINEIITGTILHPVAQFKTIVDTIIRETGVKLDTNGLKKDTSYKYDYRFSGSFEVQFSGTEANKLEKNPFYPYDVCCTINSSPTMDMSMYPLIAYNLLHKIAREPENKVVWDLSIDGDTTKRRLSGKYTLTDLRFSPSISDRALLPKQQLYLHILPIYLQWFHENGGSNLGFYKRGQVMSIPIQVK